MAESKANWRVRLNEYLADKSAADAAIVRALHFLERCPNAYRIAAAHSSVNRSVSTENANKFSWMFLCNPAPMYSPEFLGNLADFLRNADAPELDVDQRRHWLAQVAFILNADKSAFTGAMNAPEVRRADIENRIFLKRILLGLM